MTSGWRQKQVDGFFPVSDGHGFLQLARSGSGDLPTGAPKESPPPKSRRNVLLLVVAVVAILIVASAAVLLAPGGGGSGTSQGVNSFVILPSGNVTTFGGPNPLGGAGAAWGVEFLVSTNATVTGQFTATGNVSVYILDVVQWGNFPLYHNGVPYACPQECPPYFVLKDTTGGTIGAQLAPGRYWLAFDSASSVQVSVTITQGVVATGTGRVCPTTNC